MKVTKIGIAIVVLAVAANAGATILRFDETRAIGDPVVPTFGGSNVPEDYGDHVAGASQTVVGGAYTYGEQGEGYTPNVVFDYWLDSAPFDNGPTSLWEDRYGDLTNVLFGTRRSPGMTLLLAADVGYEVLLHGFDLGGWPNTDYVIDSVSVAAGGVSVFSIADVLVEGDFTGPRHTSFDFLAPLTAPALLISINYANLPVGWQDNIGIDNVRFGQNPPPAITDPGGGNDPVAVTEPGSMGLMAASVLGLIVLRRRRRATSGTRR